MKGGARPEINPWGPYAGSSAMQPLPSRPCHPSQIHSGRQSLFWPGIRFTKIKETLCGGQQASASEEIKAALEAVWARCGLGVMGEWASWGHGRSLHILNTHELMINAPASTLWTRCAGLLEAPVLYIAMFGSLQALVWYSATVMLCKTTCQLPNSYTNKAGKHCLNI